MVEINLLVMISLHVLSFAIGGHEVHVQQRGATVQMKFSARNAIQGEIGGFRVGIAGRSDTEKHVVQTYFEVDKVEQGSDAAVESYVCILHLHGTLLRASVIIVTGIISQCQQVGNFIFGYGAFFQQFFCQQVHLIVDKGAGNQPTEFVEPFAVELIFESLVSPFWQESISGNRMYGFPYHVADAVVGRFPFIVLAHPPRELAVICGTAPFSCVFVQPESTVSGVSGSQHGRIS